MRDRGTIIAGLVVFLALVTFPVWWNTAQGKTSKGPDLKLPIAAKQCVAPVAYMKSSHMELLLAWRDEVVRKNHRNFTSYDGKSYAMSLSGTCLKQCHQNKAEFCDRCHSYAAVQGPYCWDCHVDPAKVPALRSSR
jgi:hypothetical protein